MRQPALTTLALAAAAFVLIGAVAPATAEQQQKQQPQQQQKQQPQQASPPQAAPKAYKPVPVTLPKAVNDPTFDAFRQQLAGIAQKKDRAALGQVVAQNFFWIPEDQDVADKRRPAIENLAKAIGLDGRDPPGWETLAGYAGENTADPINDPQRQGVICAPGEPKIEDTAFDELVTATQTDPSEWGYPANDGIEVRSGPEQAASVIEKLGLHLVRAYPDDSPAGAAHGEALRIVTPSGKLGFVPTDLLLPLATDQLCYIKEGSAWKIAGVLGGGTPGQ
jgi:hypothetical protein